MALIRNDLIVVIGDMHLGIRELNDFHLDEKLIKFFQDLQKMGKDYNGRRILIKNGDIFDIKQTLFYFPNAAPQDVLYAICQKHFELIGYLNEFSREFETHWLIGNHDELLKQSGYKLALRQFLPEVKVAEKFTTTYLAQDKPIRLVVAHGHQYDPIEIDGWGSAFLEIMVNVLETLFPEIDNINKSSLAEFLESSLQEVYKKQIGTTAATSFNPLTAVAALLGKSIKDKTALGIQITHAYRQGILKSEGKFVREAKKIATGSRQYPEEIVATVFGHKHTAIHQVFDEKTLYVNSGCWVPEVIFSEGERRFAVKPRADAIIFSSNHNPLNPEETLISFAA